MFANNCEILNGSGTDPCSVILSRSCLVSNIVHPSFRMYRSCDVCKLIFSREPRLEYSASFESYESGKGCFILSSIPSDSSYVTPMTGSPVSSEILFRSIML